ncbi:putative Prefoldin subunit [Leishmania naiffi]|uniref:Prefoldin subunit n=1 Tax=Leishmania naiffi TaxID=5678 RepID=A0AAW3C4T1_9TRYP
MASPALPTPSPSEPAAASSLHAIAPAGVLRLERFLESVLKQNLDAVLSQRDELYATVAQCAQLRWLMDDMQALSRYHSFIEASTAAEAAAAVPLSASSPAAKGAANGSSPLMSKRAQADAYKPPQKNKILVDLGHHFYTPGVVKDSGIVYMNIGCGVVMPMSLDEAREFLRKKESVVRRMILNKSKEVLRIKYRIRLVTEAIARLNERHNGL